MNNGNAENILSEVISVQRKDRQKVVSGDMTLAQIKWWSGLNFDEREGIRTRSIEEERKQQRRRLERLSEHLQDQPIPGYLK